MAKEGRKIVIEVLINKLEVLLEVLRKVVDVVEHLLEVFFYQGHDSC